MQDDGVIDFEFSDVGIDLHGAACGSFSGSASIDQDGFIVGLTLDAYVTDKANPLGQWKKVYRYSPVPRGPNAPISFEARLARALADAIEKGCEPEINDKLNDWHVSLAEQEWEHPEAAE